MENTISYRDSVIEAITVATAQLLERKEFSKISIKEIVSLAGVGRSSFYRNFNSKEDILISYIQKLFCDIPPITDTAKDLWCQHMMEWFYVIRREEKFFLALKRDNLLDLFFVAVRSYTKQQMEKLGLHANSYQNVFFSSASIGVTILWIEKGFKESEEEMAKLLFALITGNDKALYKSAATAGS